MDTVNAWIVVGFVGQAFFTSRFLVQWLMTERLKKSVVPTAFWYLSILGGSILLFYALYRKDPVFIAGQASGLFIYFRNLHFIHKSAPQQTQCQGVV